MFTALASGLRVFIHMLDQAVVEREKEVLRRKVFGMCGWCGEVLQQPIHDVDCPAGIAAKDERKLMR